MRNTVAFLAAKSGLLTALVLSMAAHSAQLGPSQSSGASTELGSPLLRDPISVYKNWSAYDELSDNIPLTEQLAMRELEEILRLQRLGIRFEGPVAVSAASISGPD